MKGIILFSTLIIMVTCCKATSGQEQFQGIKGHVLWLEGNFMPGPGQPAKKGEPVVREIYIYELTNMNQTSRSEEFYVDITSKLVKQVTSKADGTFEVALPAGKYSIFSKEEGGFYANTFDGEGHINPVEVKADTITDFTFKIDYKAVY